ncbi:hypothetical protein [Undibacterium baiyunense]|uniref:Uncharacterized protein n=1 Tax=Undibacterium baiyunense TaxID=2828731 RepID=A0A941DD36_9BURK|nr:hypothetical protein [Undibacterium baiyunense]MBR7746020.1 hypothetical protein [Undibacterium baiyunense]
MPFTPFHFGPGAVIHAIAPKQVSFLAFCAANVMIDVEPLYFMITRHDRLHQFFHTYVGATLVALATLLLFFGCRAFARHFWLPNLFGWQDLQPKQVAVGAIIGTYSHIVLDSIMHMDITPFAPFSDINPLLRIVSLSTLHWICFGAGVLALFILAVRKLINDEIAASR